MRKRRTKIKRRAVLKGAGAIATAAAAGPWIISPAALASSGSVNILMWSDYLPDTFKRAFTKKTGIKINHHGVTSNAEIIHKMQASKGRGIDICSPTHMHSPQWGGLGLLQPFDKSRIINLKNINPAMLKVGDEEWNFGGKGAHWLPQNWGTEAVAWRTDKYSPKGAVPSYGNIWNPDVKGKAMIRPHSGMLGAGLYMETTGELEPGAMNRAYGNEKTMRVIWTQVTAFCIRNKAQIRHFWNDRDEQKNGFMNNGVVVGQTMDSPALQLRAAGKPVTYQAPKEGALAWINGMALSTAAENIDAVYAFLNFSCEPKACALAIDGHGHNSATMGADRYAGAAYRSNFATAYPGDSLSNLWTWPKEPQWYVNVRTEYVNKFKRA